MLKDNNKNTRTTSLWCFNVNLGTTFTSVSIVEFKQANVS